MEMACLLLLLLFSFWCQGLDFCASLNDEGRALLRFRERVAVDPYGALSNWNEGADDPCSWVGLECSDDGRVVALNLKDLLLEGTLTPELGKLVHLKSLVLHNNSFCGAIPKEISELQKLEILDLGHNNLTGPLPPDISSILSLEILIIRSNRYIGNIPLELHDLSKISELLVDEGQSSSNRLSVTRNSENATIRRFLHEVSKRNGHHHRHHGHNSEAPAPAPSPSPSPLQSSMEAPPPFKSNSLSSPSVSTLPESLPPARTPSATEVASPGNIHESGVHHPVLVTPASNRNTHMTVYLSVGAGTSFLAALSIIYFLCYRVNKVGTVMPWRTGLSGQLQKAFVTGIPSLGRAELESACENFSNVVGSLSDCSLYKGTLSSGVEIAVMSSMVASAKGWSEHHEAQFRKKISVLSKVNHKNFMNLIGYCEEKEPFTRMMVYEYASNGTLFEHLHVKEADHLDWAARLRIVMGIAYCLDYMHQLEPSVVIKSLNSSSIYLCEDYAAMISDLSFWDEGKEGEASFEWSGVMNSQLSTQEGNVYKFGIILLEIISGRRPLSEDDGLLVLWASSHLTGKRPLVDMVDTTLESFNEEEVVALCDIIKSCINPDPKKRLAMAEVVSQLRQITAMPPDAASPRLSPLWWAELEIISAESNSLQ